MEKESDGTLEEKPSEKIWTDNIEKVLDHLRLNCAQLSNYHRYRYVYYKRQVKWFKIPIIILTSKDLSLEKLNIKIEDKTVNIPYNNGIEKSFNK